MKSQLTVHMTDSSWLWSCIVSLQEIVSNQIYVDFFIFYQFINILGKILNSMSKCCYLDEANNNNKKVCYFVLSLLLLQKCIRFRFHGIISFSGNTQARRQLLFSLFHPLLLYEHMLLQMNFCPSFSTYLFFSFYFALITFLSVCLWKLWLLFLDCSTMSRKTLKERMFIYKHQNDIPREWLLVYKGKLGTKKLTTALITQ